MRKCNKGRKVFCSAQQLVSHDMSCPTYACTVHSIFNPVTVCLVKSPPGKEELFYFALQFVAMDSYIRDRLTLKTCDIFCYSVFSSLNHPHVWLHRLKRTHAQHVVPHTRTHTVRYTVNSNICRQMGVCSPGAGIWNRATFIRGAGKRKDVWGNERQERKRGRWIKWSRKIECLPSLFNRGHIVWPVCTCVSVTVCSFCLKAKRLRVCILMLLINGALLDSCSTTPSLCH